MDRLCTLPATELAALIASHQASSREVVEAHLQRIDEVNGYLNAVTVVLGESALAAADAADRRLLRRSVGALGPFHGVPFTVKENIDCLGSATTQGVMAFRDSMPSRDAPSVRRLEAAGAIVVARTNLSEFALRLCSDNPLRGRTLNPWNAALTPGGSSGGEAAALATGMTPLGLGNDIGGSLRNPAYCCGITALKPTAGRVARASSIMPFDHGLAGQLMAVEGPMARSVADLEVALAVMSGRDIRDPRSVDAPLHGPEPEARRAALVVRIPGVDLPAQTVAAVRWAGEILADAGWDVDEVEPPELDLVFQTWLDLMAVDFSAHLMPHLKGVLSEPVYDYMQRFCALSATPGGSDIHVTRSSLIRLWSQFFVRYPVVIGPTWTCAPWPLDADLDPLTGAAMVGDTVRFIAPANVLGVPGVAVPLGVAEGMPAGVQVLADLWREDLCLEAAAIIEEGAPPVTPIDPAGMHMARQ
jgi:amidase